MASKPKDVPYSPQSGPLAGKTFKNQFQYQDVRAKTLGFKSYAEQRKFTASPTYKAALQEAKTRGIKITPNVRSVTQLRLQTQVVKPAIARALRIAEAAPEGGAPSGPMRQKSMFPQDFPRSEYEYDWEDVFGDLPDDEDWDWY